MNMTTTQQILAHIARSREVEKGITPAPWQNYYDRNLVQQTAEPYPEVDPIKDVCRTKEFADGDFIAASRTDLLKYREALALAVEALERMPYYNNVKGVVEATLTKIAAMLEGK